MRRLLLVVVVLAVVAGGFTGGAAAFSPPEEAGAGGLYDGGYGNASQPFEIANWTQLNNTRENLDANFTLVSDLNETTTGYDSVVRTADGGFTPIGTETSQFKGTFDGDSSHIDDLYINKSRSGPDGTGLFGTVEGGVVSAVALKNASVANPTDGYTGALVGRNFGTVTEATISGNVSGSGYAVGGLVGINGASSIINQSNATSDVTGDSAVGGLVGNNDFGTIDT